MSSANLIIAPQDSNTEIEHYYDKKPPTPSPPRDHKHLPNNTIPSRAKKLVDKFTTFHPGKTRNKAPDRQLTVETTICNAGRKEHQPEVRSSKSTDTSKVKKKKRPPVNITEGMSRADIFAAKVSSAVDAWEDTDDEDFIYRDRGHSRTSSGASLNGPNPHSPFTSPHMPQGYNYSISSHNSLGYSRYGSLNRPQDYGYISGNAPDPDDYIPRNCKNFGLNKSGAVRPALPDMWMRVKGEYPNYGATEYYCPDSLQTPYYGHDSRRLPLFIKRRPQYEDKRRNTNTGPLWTMFLACFFLAVCFFFYYVSTRPLREVGIVDITSVLAADKELIFDMEVSARNFDIWDIEIVDADLDIFAIPINVGKPADQEKTKNSTESSASIIRNEYLGRILYLDEELVFTGGTHRKGIVSTATSQVRLKNPGGRSDKDAQNRWSHIFRHDFALIVRGLLKYNLPFSEGNSVRVCYARQVDGATTPNDNSTRTKQPLALDVMTACNEEWN